MVRDSTARPMKSRVHSFIRWQDAVKTARGHDRHRALPLRVTISTATRSSRAKRIQQPLEERGTGKILKTAALRAGSDEIDALPVGQVVQVHFALL
jgi:hypothetical protein